MNLLVTGGAGFIGSHLIDDLLASGHTVTNIDNFDPFYPRRVKESNMAAHAGHPRYRLFEGDIRDREVLERAFDSVYDMIIHIAARAGVRPSIADPVGYEAVNALGTLGLLEKAREMKIRKFIFASSSSVYGKNPEVPWKETSVLMPISPYAASKISAENYGRIYADLYGIHFIALRFFTVYGPRQRPDLAIHKFFELIRSGRAIPFFGDGSTSRDYTFISDIIGGIKGAVDKGPEKDKFEAFNLGNSSPVTLAELVAAIEKASGKKAALDKLPMQAGDVERTFADIRMAMQELNYRPVTPLEEGLRKFNDWFMKQ
jgi:UDP-glucuronate 4-epimerase